MHRYLFGLWVAKYSFMIKIRQLVVRPRFEVRSGKPVTFLRLTATQLGITHHQSRSTLNFGRPAF